MSTIPEILVKKASNEVMNEVNRKAKFNISIVFQVI